VEIRCSFAMRTAIFGPVVHFQTRPLRNKQIILTKFKVAAESINMLVPYCNKYCSMEIGNFIRGSGSFGSIIVNATALGNQCKAISDYS